MKKDKPVIIDLKDYASEKSFTFDYGDFYFDYIDKIKKLEDVDRYHLPDFKLPAYFTIAEKIDILNYAMNRAEEFGYYSGYVNKFHEYLLHNLNELDEAITFEYNEAYDDKITLKVYYKPDIESITSEDALTLTERLSEIGFSTEIERTNRELEQYSGDFDNDEFKYQIDERIHEVKQERKAIRASIRKILCSKDNIYRKTEQLLKIC
jgi:hypothetical protein